MKEMKSKTLVVELKNEDVNCNENAKAKVAFLSAADETDNKFENIDENLKDLKYKNQTGDAGKECNLFGFFGEDTKNGASNAVWVQFQGMGGQYGSGGGGGFDYDPDTRNQFIKLVFIIVLLMLLITAGFTVMVFMIESLNEAFLKYSMIILIAGSIVMIAMSYAMNCSECTRVPPCNFICLLIALVGMTAICAATTVHYETHLIMFALIATMVTVFVCIILACTSFDFTKFFIYIIVISTAFAAVCMIYWIYNLVTGNSMPVIQLILLIVGTLLNVIILTMELQMILGGKTMEISESDYALAAFMLYTSIVDIFLRFVQMCGIIDQLMDND